MYLFAKKVIFCLLSPQQKLFDVIKEMIDAHATMCVQVYVALEVHKK